MFVLLFDVSVFYLEKSHSKCQSHLFELFMPLGQCSMSLCCIIPKFQGEIIFKKCLVVWMRNESDKDLFISTMSSVNYY
jgi:hypothetical protein